MTDNQVSRGAVPTWTPQEQADQEALDAVTARIVAKDGYIALWMEAWSGRPCAPFRFTRTATALVCGDCGKPFVKVGVSRLHAGDPRLVLLGIT